jgi:hypothetical protein
MPWTKALQAKALRRRQGGAAPQPGSDTPAAPAQAARPGATPSPDSARPVDAHATCACHGEGLPLLASAAADEREVLAICLVRFIMAGHASGKLACWEGGFATSLEVLGPVEGPAVLARALALVHAIRHERRRDFRFMPAHCVRISEDEQDLLAVLQAAREGDPLVIEAFAAMLAGQPEVPRLQLASRLLAAQLYPPRPVPPHTAPQSATRH